MISLALRKSHNGFALIDILVALTVAGLAGSILVGLLAFVDRSSHEARESARVDEEIVAISRILRNLTEEAYSVGAQGRGVTPPHGTEIAFVIATMGPRILSVPKPTIFILRSAAQDGRTRITLQWIDPETEQEHLEAVSAGLDYAEFSYFGRRNNSEERSWHSMWRVTDGRLEAVRLTVRMPRLSRPVDFIAPLRGDLALQCIRNPHRSGCILTE